jgi:hypothetical protein
MPTPAGRSDTSQGLQSQPGNHGFELSELKEWLPPLLSVIAGMVDLTGFFMLGNISTAHVTGNLVLAAAAAVRGGPLNWAQVLSIPIFIFGGYLVTSQRVSQARIGFGAAVATRTVSSARGSLGFQCRYQTFIATSRADGRRRGHDRRRRDGLSVCPISPGHTGRNINGGHDRQFDQYGSVIDGSSADAKTSVAG